MEGGELRALRRGFTPIAGGGWERCRVVPWGCGRASFLLKLDVVDEAGSVEKDGKRG